jgi:hypothetical protein
MRFYDHVLFLQNEEARIAREVELYEKRIRREIERQDIARRKVSISVNLIHSGSN